MPHARGWASFSSKKVIDFNRGEDVFPGQREEGAGHEGACSYGGELFIVLGEAVNDEPTELKREHRWLCIRHNLD